MDFGANRVSFLFCLNDSSGCVRIVLKKKNKWISAEALRRARDCAVPTHTYYVYSRMSDGGTTPHNGDISVLIVFVL